MLKKKIGWREIGKNWFSNNDINAMDLVTGSYSAKVIENFQRLDKYMEEDDRWK